jgi:hypothetical protein
MRYHRDRHQGKHGAVYAKVEFGPHESVWVIEKLEKGWGITALESEDTRCMLAIFDLPEREERNPFADTRNYSLFFWMQGSNTRRGVSG